MKLNKTTKDHLLKLINSDHKVIINPAKESRTFDQFISCTGDKPELVWIDPDFNKLKDQERLVADKTIELSIYQLQQTATFKEIVESMAVEKDQLCLGQEHIIQFVNSYHYLLKTKCYGTVFLLKTATDYNFVRVISEYSGRIIFRLHQYTSESKWDCQLDLYIVFPKINLIL